MKFLVVLFALVVLVVGEHHEHHVHHDDHDYVVKTRDDLVKYREDCIAKLGISPEHVQKYKHWEYPDDEVTHCYMKCIFEHFGFFDEHHGFDVKKIHHQLAGVGGTVDHEDAVHKQIEHCADSNSEGSDPCTWAYRSGMCFIKSNLQLVKSSVTKTD